jgi:hypothetical protein
MTVVFGGLATASVLCGVLEQDTKMNKQNMQSNWLNRFKLIKDFHGCDAGLIIITLALIFRQLLIDEFPVI